MSRTDKDLPQWYAEWYKPDHRCTEFPSARSWFHNDGPCDLPSEPIVHSPNHLVRFSYRAKDPTKIAQHNISTKCTWTPVQPLDWRQWYDKNPRWWIDHNWLLPERVRVRDTCRRAVQDYNANGATDIEIADHRGKHNGGWYW